MRFGTFFFFQAAPGLTHADVVHRELEQMEWTEELGFDQIWLTEHHFIDYGLAVDPASLAAAAASRTRRVRIGLAAAILPFHHPLRLAEQMALIDIISRGRLDVGVGRGNRPAEFKGTTSRSRKTASASTRPCDIILKAWTEERFTHEGRFYTDPRGPRDPQALAEAAPAHLPGLRQRGRHRELGRARLAHAELAAHGPGRSARQSAQ